MTFCKWLCLCVRACVRAHACMLVCVHVRVLKEYDSEGLSQTCMKSNQPVSNQPPEVTFTWHDFRPPALCQAPAPSKCQTLPSCTTDGAAWCGDWGALYTMSSLLGRFSSLTSSPPPSLVTGTWVTFGGQISDEVRRVRPDAGREIQTLINY